MKSLFIFLIVVLYTCAAFAAPDNNPSPNDRVEVTGAIPDDVEAVLVEDWYTTTDSMFCQHMVGEAGFMPSHFAKRATQTSAANGQRSWLVWRDDVKSGHCGWALKQVVVYLDSKASNEDPVQASNIPVRVAYVCGTGENCLNTWASNDDSDKPTYHRCNLASVSQLAPGNSTNPCAYFDAKARGTDLGKYEHILRPDQHTVRFVITEVGKQNP
ncbi:hypothetical protein [Paraburkholderia sediminicola]|uniref:hypothetical protein n=1 Tax=Paraburkholderia sediminicola TaxID=458836 RepID=UPI0038B9E894